MKVQNLKLLSTNVYLLSGFLIGVATFISFRSLGYVFEMATGNFAISSRTKILGSVNFFAMMLSLLCLERLLR